MASNVHAVQSASCYANITPTDPPFISTHNVTRHLPSNKYSHLEQGLRPPLLIVKDRTNVALANEMGGHFLCAMSLLQFLDECLPLNAGVASQAFRKDQLKGHFDAEASAGR